MNSNDWFSGNGQMKELLKRLVEADGPSGFEDRVRELIRTAIEPHADELFVDALGNLIALKKGDGSGLKVMVAAHMDEIGVMASHVTEQGFLRFTNIGGVDPRTLLGARVRFGNGTVGIVHSDRLKEKGSINPLEKHFIDVGATGRDDCPVRVGDPGSFVGPLLIQGKRFTAKSMDDRIGCLVAIESLRLLARPSHDVYFVFSVQEEVGVRGAQVAASRLDPDVGIALDVTKTGDVPESAPMAIDLGAGPAIKVKDSGMIAHKGLVRVMRQRAENARIPYQLEVLEGGSTDASAIQIANSGSVAGCISIPCRYVHSQSETVDGDDVNHAIKLMVEVLANPLEV
jgi:endoglucanase